MKELVVISGKGGTGKTSIVASLAALAENKVMVDCDVDAADLHLVLNPKTVYKEDFYAGKIAKIDPDKCTSCGKCKDLCRFKNCEGCSVCAYFCPNSAIEMIDKKSGEWFESDTRFGKLVHAKLGIAEDNSGKLVTKIRNHARLTAKRENADLIIVDGSPGVGCPVIASISGASLVVIITEPTLSGLHDLERVYQLTKHFKIPAKVIVNKFDINPKVANQIESFCKENRIDLLGKIRYSRDFTNAMINEQTLVEYSNNEISVQLREIWEKLNEICYSNS